MKIQQNIFSINFKRNISIGLLFLHAVVGIISISIEESKNLHSFDHKTSVQESPITHHSDEFRPSLFSQLNHAAIRGSFLKAVSQSNFLAIVYLSLSDTKSLKSASFGVSNESILSQLSVDLSRVLRL